MEFSERLKNLRSEKGISQAKLAELIKTMKAEIAEIKKAVKNA